jgi:hypothetical protein
MKRGPCSYLAKLAGLFQFGGIAQQLRIPFVAVASPHLLGCASFTEIASQAMWCGNFKSRLTRNGTPYNARQWRVDLPSDRRVRSCIATLLDSMAWRATPHRIPRRGVSYRVSGAGMMSGLALPHLYEPGSSLNT